MFDARRMVFGMTLYSPWFPRGGDFVVVTAECIVAFGLDPTLKIELFHKNTSDRGDGTNVDTGVTPKNIQLSTVGRSSADWKSSATLTGLKELVRYRFTMSGSAGNEAMEFRLLPPVWYDNDFSS